jgi:hypothetical protein
MAQVPRITTRTLTASHIPTGGVKAAATCILQDNVNVIEINNQRVEVHECDSSIDGSTVGNGGGASPLPSDALPASAQPGNHDPAASATTSPSGGGIGVATPAEDCELFSESLKSNCSKMPAADRASCNYNACMEEQQCLGQPISQCGPKPKQSSQKNVVHCANAYAANFNSCTGRFRTVDDQNSCLFAAGNELKSCSMLPIQPDQPLDAAPRPDKWSPVRS